MTTDSFALSFYHCTHHHRQPRPALTPLNSTSTTNIVSSAAALAHALLGTLFVQFTGMTLTCTQVAREPKNTVKPLNTAAIGQLTIKAVLYIWIMSTSRAILAMATNVDVSFL